MENIDKGLTAVPKWVLIVLTKIPQMPQNISAICPSPKVLDFNEKRLHWVSVVCAIRASSKTILNYDRTMSLNLLNFAQTYSSRGWKIKILLAFLFLR